MTKSDNEALIARCDQLTENGQVLSIDWEGGGDSGEFTMKLNGEDVSEQTEIDERIIELVAEGIGYESFACHSSTHGSAISDRWEKSFSGTDFYSSSDQGVEECSIKLTIPSWLWFDR